MAKRSDAVVILVALVCGTQLAASCANDPVSDRTSDDNNYTDRIPEDARLVKEGSGEIRYRATANGRIWLYDVQERSVRYQTDLLDGDTVRVVPQDDRVYINDTSVKVKSLPDDRAHRIYFDGRRGNGNDRVLGREDEPSRMTGVPSGAEVVVESRGTEDLSYKARENGRVYLYDQTNSRLVATFNIKKGQRVTVVPANDNAAIDGRIVLEGKGLSRRSTYRLLFGN
ncbi:MAG: hypothetical protein H7144_00095 [Burkholderiales bacterium]|nr:hypothetical protein [Phycisphaerae bacterium]